MNIERLKQVRNIILEHPGQFNYAWVISPCGTTGCIAGWACFLKKQAKQLSELRWRWDSAHGTIAQEWLDLTDDQAQELFFNPSMLFCTSAERAADFIDQFIARHTPVTEASATTQVAKREEVLA